MFGGFFGGRVCDVWCFRGVFGFVRLFWFCLGFLSFLCVCVWFFCMFLFVVVCLFNTLKHLGQAAVKNFTLNGKVKCSESG